MEFIEVARVDEITSGKMKSFDVKGKNILVANYDGNYYAIGGKCTHRGGDLSKGKLEGKIVTCPKHGSQFEVTTGKCIAGPKIGLLRLNAENEIAYEVRVKDKSIQVGI